MAVADDRSVKILIWNYHDYLVPADSAPIRLKVKLPPDFGSKAGVTHYRIDDTHSNAYTKWLELGSPQNLSPEMFAELKSAMKLERLEPSRLIDIMGGEARLDFELPRFGLSLLVLNRR
jgi:xylan 1,4-beta-xylosidase